MGTVVWKSSERFGGGAGELAGLAVEGEPDEVDLFAAVAVRLGVALLLDLGKGLLGRSIDLEFEDEDAFGGLGDQVRAALGLAVFGSDTEEAAGGQQNVEDTLEGEFLHAVLFGTVGQMCVEVGEVAEEGLKVCPHQGTADNAEVAVVFLPDKFLDELSVEGTAHLFVRNAEGEGTVSVVFNGKVTALVKHGDGEDVPQAADIQVFLKDALNVLVVSFGELVGREIVEDGGGQPC